MNKEPNKKPSISGNPFRRKAKINESSNYLFGKVQPQAIPLEEAVLGALMLDKDGLVTVMELLVSSAFYVDAHKEIYKAIINLFEKSQPVDLLTVAEQLKKNGKLDEIGGPHYLVELTNKVSSAANIEYHARIISEMYIKRERDSSRRYFGMLKLMISKSVLLKFPPNEQTACGYLIFTVYVVLLTHPLAYLWGKGSKSFKTNLSSCHLNCN